MMNTEDYLNQFPEKLRDEAFKVALDTREFEIELYWKRATYFWTFIAVTFAGYGLVQRSDDFPEKSFMSFFLSCLGFILSFGWVLANRGSKHWQENWEHHVDNLEDSVTGPLFKITLPRVRPSGFWQWLDFLIVGPSRHSVSKINQLISTYIAVMWLVLVVRSQDTWDLSEWAAADIVVLALTIVGCVGLLCGSRTYRGPHWHRAEPRTSEIREV